MQLAKERELDLKRVLREEQAILRKEQAQKRKNFLEEIKLEKKIQNLFFLYLSFQYFNGKKRFNHNPNL